MINRQFSSQKNPRKQQRLKEWNAVNGVCRTAEARGEGLLPVKVVVKRRVGVDIDWSIET